MFHSNSCNWGNLHVNFGKFSLVKFMHDFNLVFSQTHSNFQIDVADKNENDKMSGVDLLLTGSFQAFGEVSNGK